MKKYRGPTLKLWVLEQNWEFLFWKECVRINIKILILEF